MFVENKMSDCFVQLIGCECFRKEGVEVMVPATHNNRDVLILSAIVGGGRRFLFLRHDGTEQNGMNIACAVQETTMDSLQQ